MIKVGGKMPTFFFLKCDAAQMLGVYPKVIESYITLTAHPCKTI